MYKRQVQGRIGQVGTIRTEFRGEFKIDFEGARGVGWFRRKDIAKSTEDGGGIDVDIDEQLQLPPGIKQVRHRHTHTPTRPL